MCIAKPEYIHLRKHYLGESVTNQNVSAGNAAEPQVLYSSLLELDVSVAQLAVGAQDILDGGFDLWEQVDELDVCGQQERPSRHRAQVEFGVQKVELDQWTGRKSTTNVQSECQRQRKSH